MKSRQLFVSVAFCFLFLTYVNGLRINKVQKEVQKLQVEGGAVCPSLRITPNPIVVGLTNVAPVIVETITVPPSAFKLIISGENIKASDCTLDFSTTKYKFTINVGFLSNAKVSGKLVVKYFDSQYAACPSISVTVNPSASNTARAGSCTCSGDPHIATFDQVRYDYFGVGDFYLTRTDDASFVVQSRFNRCGGVSCTSSTVVKFKTDIFVFSQQTSPKKQAYVYRLGTPVTGALLSSSSVGTYVLTFPEGYRIQVVYFNNFDFLSMTINVPSSTYGKTKGLCGVLNANYGDDYEARPAPGQVTGVRKPVAEFVNSWRVPNEENLLTQQTKANIPVYAPPNFDKNLRDCNAEPYPSPVPLPAPLVPVVPMPMPTVPPTPVPIPVHVPDTNAPWPNPDLKKEAEKQCGAILVGPIHDACIALKITQTYLSKAFDDCITDTRITGNIETANHAICQVYKDCSGSLHTNPNLPPNTPLPPALQCPEACYGLGTCVNGKCVCNLGYSGTTCEIRPSNPCLYNNGACPARSVCSFTTYGKSCTCSSGFIMTNGKCEDVDECKTNNGGCIANSVCTNTVGSRECNCKQGYAFNGVACADVNECANNNGGCSVRAICKNTDGSRTCTCGVGYTGNGIDCTDVDECKTNNGGCHANAGCFNTLGSRTCTCLPGYTGNGLTCSDVNECLAQNGGCHENAICRNTVGSRTCTCKPGFDGDGIKTCNDVNECVVKNGGCNENSICVNTIGSRTCQCKPGFQGDNCIDINECASNNGGCSILAVCTNIAGSRTCACKVGYTGDGITCKDINECLVSNGGCSPYAQCTNTAGSRSCACNSQYTGNGILCCPAVRVNTSPIVVPSTNVAPVVIDTATAPSVPFRVLLTGDNVKSSTCILDFDNKNFKFSVNVGFLVTSKVSGRLNLKFSDKVFESCLPVTVPVNPNPTNNANAGTCSASGDPHITTYDNVRLNYYGVGDFYFTRTDDGLFVVQTRYRACGRVSCTSEVAVKFRTETFLFGYANGKPSVQRTSTTTPLPTTILTSTSVGHYILKFEDGYQVKVDYWGSFTNVYVTVPAAAYGKTKGVCGVLNSNGADDFQARPAPGQSVGVLKPLFDFVNSWRVPADENLISGPSYARIPAYAAPIFDRALRDCNASPPNNNGGTVIEPDKPIIPPPPHVDPVYIPDLNPLWPNSVLKTEAEKICGTLKSSPLRDDCLKLKVPATTLDQAFTDCLLDTKAIGDISVAIRSVTDVRDICVTNIYSNPSVPSNTAIPSTLVCTSACSGLGVCKNSMCVCSAGYAGSDCSQRQKNPCLENNGGCASNSECSLSPIGAVVCNCKPGYTYNGQCVDIDECKTNNGGCGDPKIYLCTNSPGSRTCSCKTGYTYNGVACVDVNECSFNNGGCSPFAKCTNTVGSRTCTCATGYTGDGTSCVDVNECLKNNGGCHANAVCSNTPGSRTCTCLPGYMGTGLVCNVDPSYGTGYPVYGKPAYG